jgi:chromosome segregation ATPase
LAGDFDAGCRHHEPAVASHAAQSLFEQLADLPAGAFTAENAARMDTNARSRELVLRQNQAELEAELSSTQALLTAMREALIVVMAARLTQNISATETEARVRPLAEELSAAKAQINRLAVELTAADAEANRRADELASTKTEAGWLKNCRQPRPKSRG